MLMLHALRSRPVRRLWLGQVGSTVGDELYKLAFIWLAVDILGSDTGFIASLQYAVVIAIALFGGHITDRMRNDQVMIRIDLIRMLLCIIPVIPFLFGYPNFLALIIPTLSIVALGALFDPALQGALPILARDQKTLRAGNNLMGTTYRLARVIGPSLISILSVWFQPFYFFILNAISYVFSAVSVRSIKKEFEHASVMTEETESFSWKQGFLLARKDKNLMGILWIKSVSAGFWAVGYTLGLVLLAKDVDPTGFNAYGWVMASYGVGNLSSALIFGNIERKRSEEWLYLGITLIGVSFMALYFCHSIASIGLFSAICAIGGPMNDTPFIEIVQDRFKVKDQVKIFRLKMVFENIFMLLFTVLSPFVFNQFGIRIGIAVCGLGCVLSVAIGLGLNQVPQKV